MANSIIRVSNNLNPDQDRPYVGPDLDLNCLQRLGGTGVLVYVTKDLKPTMFEKNWAFCVIMTATDHIKITLTSFIIFSENKASRTLKLRQYQCLICLFTWVKVFRINPEFRILRLTFHIKSAIRKVIIASLIYFLFV